MISEKQTAITGADSVYPVTIFLGREEMKTAGPKSLINQ